MPLYFGIFIPTVFFVAKESVSRASVHSKGICYFVDFLLYFRTSHSSEKNVFRASVRLKDIRCLVDVLWVRTDPAKGSAELHPGILSMKVLIPYFHPFKLFILSYFHISFFQTCVSL